MDLNIDIIKSPLDKNTYKLIKLPNELVCLLISDPDADKSAASLTVDIGSCDEPAERPGLAHFLEHMLFMGTKKYPDQNDYANYLNQNSGYNNAYTSQNHTNYYLDCSNEAFEGALDRFSQFFIAPLLDKSSVDKEINAVNSENEMCIISDSWREYMLFKMSSKPGHVYNKFSVGNLKSLQHPTIRDDVIKFYNESYSANHMRLSVYSKSDIQTLENWVKTYFSEVENKNYPKRVFTEVPFSKDNLSRFYKIVPNKDNDYIDFVWIFEGLHEHYKQNPLKYFSHLFGHEGENSLLSFLKEEGLATELTSGDDEELNLFTSFSVRIKLTPLGFENYKDVIAYTFQYLNMLKKIGPQAWKFDEIKKTRNMKFTFQEKTDPVHVVSGVSPKLLYYPYQDVLKINYFMEEYQEAFLNEILHKFTLDNLRINLISKKTESECNLLEEWYQVKHTFGPFEQYVRDYYEGKNLPTAKRTKKRLDLPPVNEFIPSNFDLLHKEASNLPTEPQKIKSEELSDVWFKPDTKFNVPKAVIFVRLYLRDGSFGNSIESYLLAKLWGKLFEHYTQEMVYLAREGNTDLDFNLGSHFYLVEAQGYSHTILTVITKFFEKLVDFKPEEHAAIFEDLHHDQLQAAKNFIKDKPHVTARSLVKTFLKAGTDYHPNQVIDALKKIKFEDLLAFHKIILQRIKLVWLFTGNLSEKEVLGAVAHVEDIFTNKRIHSKVKPLKNHEIPEVRVVQLPDNTTWAYEYHLQRENESEIPNPNSAIMKLFQAKIHNDNTRILNDLLDNYLRESFFDQLRTNEQLGYVVYSHGMQNQGVNFFTFGIQSDVKWPQFLRQRIASFLETVKESVEKLSDEDYTKYVESVRTEYLQKPLQLYDEAERIWDEINMNKFDWNRRARFAEEIQSIPKSAFQEFVKETFFQNPRKFEVHVVAESMKEENQKLRGESTDKVEYVHSDEAFKRKMVLYPDFYAAN